MSAKSKIEWTDATWNPTLGCSKCSQGCRGCYAIRSVHRMAGNPNPKIRAANTGLTHIVNGHPEWTGVVRLLPERLEIPLRRRTPTAYFVDSLSDLFHESVTDGEILRVYQVMVQCPWHTFMVLTKRAGRLLEWSKKWIDTTEADYEPKLARGPKAVREAHTCGRAHMFASMLESMGTPPPGCAYPLYDWMQGMVYWPNWFHNIRFGVSVEDRSQLRRIDQLRETPAALRFLSLEPLLEDLGELDLRGIGWVIVGGESGPGARPMHPDWARSVRDQCQAAGVPFFFKQWGEYLPDSQNHAMTPEGRRLAEGTGCAIRVGKKAAGRLLDGREWSELPGRRESAKEKP